MTIIKHGKPKERLRFICHDCGCEWKARVGETDQNMILGYRMKCPDCGFITKPETIGCGYESRTLIFDSFAKNKMEVNDDTP